MAPLRTRAHLNRCIPHLIDLSKGGPVSRRNLLHRQLKPTVKKLGLPPSVDFRNFRTMHSSLMSSIGVRPRSDAGRHGTRHSGCDAKHLQPHVVGRKSGSCEHGCRCGVAQVFGGCRCAERTRYIDSTCQSSRRRDSDSHSRLKTF